jgi:hypothetical protein
LQQDSGRASIAWRDLSRLRLNDPAGFSVPKPSIGGNNTAKTSRAWGWHCLLCAPTPGESDRRPHGCGLGVLESVEGQKDADLQGFRERSVEGSHSHIWADMRGYVGDSGTPESECPKIWEPRARRLVRPVSHRPRPNGISRLTPCRTSLTRCRGHSVFPPRAGRFARAWRGRCYL